VRHSAAKPQPNFHREGHEDHEVLNKSAWSISLRALRFVVKNTSQNDPVLRVARQKLPPFQSLGMRSASRKSWQKMQNQRIIAHKLRYKPDFLIFRYEKNTARPFRIAAAGCAVAAPGPI
jgi:hypothetical protein